MANEKKMILSGLSILFESEWVNGHALILEEGQIKAIISEQHIHNHLPGLHYTFPKNFYLIPGLIDCHVHGANGYDVMDATPEAINAISLALAKEGVTGFLATTMTASTGDIQKVLKNIAQHHLSAAGAKCLGIHLEGPFLAPAKAGAQEKEWLLPPDIELFSEWQKLTNNLIRLVTIAPELEGALDFIKTVSSSGVNVSIGHTEATYAETLAAIEAGCTHATHLFNAMRGLHHREPGAVGALLFSNLVSAEIIVDGIHLHPAIVKMAMRLKSFRRLMLVTDAMRAKCLGDGSYTLGNQVVTVTNQTARLADSTLAGSVLQLPHAIQNIVSFTGCPLEEAIWMASGQPARLLGLEQQAGTLAIGKSADCVVLDKSFQPILTIREGRVIFSADARCKY